MIFWKLAETLRNKGIANPSQLKKALEEKMGVSISRQALSKLIENEPQSFRLETAQLLCNLLEVPLEEFLRITPDGTNKTPKAIIKPYKGSRKLKNHSMKNPMAFFQ